MSGRFITYKLIAILLAALLSISGLFVSVPVMAATRQGTLAASAGPDSTPAKAGELLVKLKPGVVPSKFFTAFFGSDALPDIDNVSDLGITRIKIDSDRVQLLKTLLGNNQAISFVQENHIYKAQGVPSDPQYSQQWGLSIIHASQAWDSTKGAGVKVAIVDSGVDLNHPDLAANIDHNSNGSVNGYNVFHDTSIFPVGSYGYDASSLPTDKNGHGTHVAGIVAAAENGQGVVGVAPKAKIIPVRVLDKDGEGDDLSIAQGIHWAADHGARVINLSLGGPSVGSVVNDAIKYARGKGDVIVAAAGNYGKGTISYPAALPGVISVAATTNTNELASFSNYGSGLDVSAPGAYILSTLPTYNVTLNQEGAPNNYGYMDGTSMASPFAAGVAALVIANNPGFTPDQVEQKMKSTTLDLGPKGTDTTFGAGLLDAGKAAQSEFAPAPTPTPEQGLEQKATVNVSSANVRSGPGTINSVITVVNQGTVFNVTGASGNWSKVKLANGTSGYVATSLIKLIEDNATVTSAQVNVRSGPSTQYSVIATVVEGQIFKVLGKVNNWFKVRLSSGTVGYVAGWLVKLVDSSSSGAGQHGVVSTTAANVRTGPGTNYTVITSIPKGTSVNITGQQGTWYRVLLADGRSGYMSQSTIQIQ